MPSETAGLHQKQSYKDYEVIVADADSKDKTVAIAKSMAAKL